MISSEIHGWRLYSIINGVLEDIQGNIVVSADTPAIGCTTHDDWEVPDLACDCGYEGYFPFPYLDVDAIAHTTALGFTVVYANGWRTAKCVIDYLVEPIEPNDRLTNIATQLGIPIYHRDYCKPCEQTHKEAYELPILELPLMKIISIPKFVQA